MKIKEIEKESIFLDYLEQLIINECNRLKSRAIPIYALMIPSYIIHVHQNKRIHITPKTTILAHPTIHMIKYTKKRKERLK